MLQNELLDMMLTLKGAKCDLDQEEYWQQKKKKKAIHQRGWRETEAALFGLKGMMGGDVRKEKWGKAGRQTGEKTERSAHKQQSSLREETKKKPREMKREEAGGRFKEISFQID